MISSALYRFFGMVQISLRGFLPLSIWTSYFGLGQGGVRAARSSRVPFVFVLMGRFYMVAVPCSSFRG
jgi:hypothetical protein